MQIYSGKLARILGYSQGLYYVLTGLWPLFHLASFMAVTGPKTDTWLVKMVGLLAASIGIYLLVKTIRRRVGNDTILLCIFVAASFSAIDLYYAGIVNLIRDIYLLDMAIELLFIGGWLRLFIKRYKSGTRSPLPPM